MGFISRRIRLAAFFFILAGFSMHLPGSSGDTNVVIAKLLRPKQVSLGGQWHFREDPGNIGEQEAWFMSGSVRGRTSLVPLPWQLIDEELREYLGVAWYEREFEVPGEDAGRRVAIEFIGIDHEARVWVNGEPAGQHTGSLSSFILDVSRHVKYGEKNTVTIKVTDPELGTRSWVNEQVISFSGLWRDVYLEITEPVFISDIFMVPDIDRSHVRGEIEVTVPPLSRPQKLSLRLKVKAPNGKNYQSARIPVEFPALDRPATRILSTDVNLKKCILWQLDDPALYETTCELFNHAGDLLDSARVQFGMRKIETRGKHIYLNNQPIYLVGGWLDPSPLAGPDEVNWAMPGPYKPLSDEDIQRDIQSAKSININLLRRILRSINPRFIHWADRLGILIWDGGPWIPASGIATREIYDKYKQDYGGIVKRDRNHPSIVIWELFCESFGIPSGQYGTWSKTLPLVNELYDHVKSVDGTRLVLDNAGGRGPYDFNYLGAHAKTDIDDVCFLGLSSPAWIQSVREFRDNCRLITEYGKPVTNSLLNNKTSRIFNPDKARQIWKGQTPWWFTAPEGITTYSSYITGYEDRYYKWGFDEIFGNFDRFTEASDWYQFKGIKYQAEEMRKNPDMSGYLSFAFDCIPHVIAAIDPFRDKKVFSEQLDDIYAQDLVMIDLEKRTFWAGENARASIIYSHFGDSKPEQCVAEWKLEEFDVNGTLQDFVLQRGDVKRIGDIEFKTPQLDEGRMLRLTVVLKRKGRVISRNFEEIYVFPHKYRKPKIDTINLAGPFHATVRRLDILGYEYTRELDPSVPVAVTRNIDQALIDFMEAGGNVLLLACDELDLIGFMPDKAINPVETFLKDHGLILGGNEFHFGGIVGSLYIRKTPGLFDRIPFDNPIAWPFHTVAPRHVLIGLQSGMRDDILAGAYGSFFRNSPFDSTGQVHPCEITGTILQARYGKGKLVISTFDLLNYLALEPVATIMFNDLVAYTADPLRPSMELTKIP